MASMTLREFQQWLIAHGAGIIADNLRGPRTRAAILSVFANLDAPKVTDAQIITCAARLGCTVRQLRAVAAVESNGSGFLRDGLPLALYERHYFWKRWRIKIPPLSDPAPGGYTIDADRDGINDSWEKIADAAMINPVAAFESASFGKFQIMGAWAEKMGYANAVEFVYALSRSEGAHFDALVRFIEFNGLQKHLRALSSRAADCVAFARAYNGPAYARNSYDVKLAKAMMA